MCFFWFSQRSHFRQEFPPFYFTGAGLSLFTPPPLINKKVKGFNSIKAHKVLAMIHFPAMVSTSIFKNKNKKIHKYSAYTAFASYATAIIVFKF